MSSFDASLSGLNAAATQVGVAAVNLANLNTNGYKAKSVTFEQTAEGGVRPSGVQESQAEPAPNGSNVDPATEMENLQTGSVFYRANVTALKAQAELLGLVMDLKA